jgi:FMN-dependent NADH-azoreductase
MKLLHIIASPRSDGSSTLPLSEALLAELGQRFPDLEVETLDLFTTDLPAMAGTNIDAKYNLLAGRPVDEAHAESWGQIEAEIERFRSADAYVITAPMWNFGVPYALKYYIDCIVQPGYLFRFTPQGYPEPLLHDKRMVVVSSSGSDYSEGSPMHALNFHEPYLRTIFGFVGITDVTFVNAFSVDMAQRRAVVLEDAHAAAKATAWDAGWERFETVAA